MSVRVPAAVVAVVTVLLLTPSGSTAAGTWAAVQPPVPGHDVDALSVVDARSAWAVCAGALWRTADGGATWTEVRPPTPEFTLLGFVDPATGWVAGPPAEATHDRALFGTQDAGESWRELPARIPATCSWVVPWSTPGSAEYHEHWTSQSVLRAWFPDASHGYWQALWHRWVWPEDWAFLYDDLGYETRLAHSDDSGATWHEEYATTYDLAWNPPPDCRYVLGTQSFPQSDASLVVALAWPLRGAYAVLTPDGSPVRWLTGAPSTADQTPALVAVAPTGRLWWTNSVAAGNENNLWRSDDGGATWSRVRIGGLGWWQAWDLCLLGDGRRGFLLLGLDDGRRAVYATADGGGTWAPTELSFTPTPGAEYRFAPGSGGCASWLYGPGLLRRWVEDPLDTRPPTTTVEGADDAWHPEAVTLSFAADDARGAPVVQHRLAGGPWRPGTALTLSPGRRGHGSGAHTVEFRAFDPAGNLEATHTCVVRIDARPPRTCDDLPALPLAADTLVHLTASDPHSGVAATYWAVDGGAWHTGSEALLRVARKRALAPGPHLLAYFSVDAAGNAEPLRVVPFEVSDILQPI